MYNWQLYGERPELININENDTNDNVKENNNLSWLKYIFKTLHDQSYNFIDDGVDSSVQSYLLSNGKRK